MSRDIEDQLDRDAEKEPHAIRRHARLDARGTVQVATMRAKHGAECACAWCNECPRTAEALAILRRIGAL